MLDGVKIEERLKELNMSAKYLADEVGVSTTMMSFIINGKRDTTVRVACSIAETLDCALEEILKQ